ncbi:hypothetical protein AALP_AA2G085600 [Arabis alpina]|uniref:Uncharacterized protein n=1 Tax=Arabis alpina TaxID=50452 RepID=A0A087HG47_ARAAL|nr:hypothetical protein AALP_AA2G085600 [Arabis alpina]
MMEPLLDSISLLLSQNSDNNNLSRGPRYGEYARLRESKLRMKRDFERILKEEEERFFGGDKPRKKQTRFGEENQIPENRRRLSSSSPSLAQSVPDFSAMIRKENRRPVHSNLLPPSMKSRNAAVFAGSASSTRGSMSAGEKKMGMARKSYATVQGSKSIGGGRSILGYRQIY